MCIHQQKSQAKKMKGGFAAAWGTRPVCAFLFVCFVFKAGDQEDDITFWMETLPSKRFQIMPH